MPPLSGIRSCSPVHPRGEARRRPFFQSTCAATVAIVTPFQRQILWAPGRSRLSEAARTTANRLLKPTTKLLSATSGGHP